jgi:hypothetical protein
MRRMMIALLPVTFTLTAPSAAQETRSLAPGARSPAATIDQLGWLAGSWTGEAMGGPVSETYSAPLGGRITGHFVASDGKGGVSFTELVDYVPVGRSIAYRVRHFGPDMKGWEDKTGKPVVFPLVAVEGSRWYFDGMTLDRTAPDALTMWVRIEDGGRATDVPFRLARAAG